MALRGKQPETIEKRLKLLMYGPPGVGKTTAAISMPSPYLIDTERGAENDQYVKALKASGGAYFFTTDPNELLQEVRSLVTEQHDYRTLVIDPLTVIYNDLLDKSAEALVSENDPTGTSFSRHKGPADRVMKRLVGLLMRLDMNIIVTSHAKAKWKKAKNSKGADEVVEDGTTFDCYGKLDYLFDLVLELTRRGKDRVATVRKSRIEAFVEGATFDFSYNAIADMYGRNVIERKAIAIELASAEQVAELREALALRKDGETLEGKWIKAAGVETLNELTKEQAAKCIAAITGKVTA